MGSTGFSCKTLVIYLLTCSRISRRKIVRRHFEGVRHCLVKSARARRALVVHGEVLHRAVGRDGDTFDVLTADVDDRLDRGIGDVHAHGVTADLGDVLVGKGDLVAPVARADEIRKLFGRIKPRDLVYRRLQRQTRALGRIYSEIILTIAAATDVFPTPPLPATAISFASFFIMPLFLCLRKNYNTDFYPFH